MLSTLILVTPTSDVDENSSLSAIVSGSDEESFRTLLSESHGTVGGNGSTPYYSADAIRARIGCAGCLETYAVHLSLIANSTSAAQAQAALTSLGASVESFGTEIANTGLPHSAAAGKEIQKLSGPIVQLGSLSAQAIVKYFRSAWAKQIIQANQDAVNRTKNVDGCTIR